MTELHSAEEVIRHIESLYECFPPAVHRQYAGSDASTRVLNTVARAHATIASESVTPQEAQWAHEVLRVGARTAAHNGARNPL